MFSLRNQDKVSLKDEDRGSGQEKTILKRGSLPHQPSAFTAQEKLWQQM